MKFRVTGRVRLVLGFVAAAAVFAGTAAATTPPQAKSRVVDAGFTYPRIVPAVHLAPAPVPASGPPAVVMPNTPPLPNPAGCPSGYAALTFDDGPTRAYTNTLVDYLVRAQVPATFFVTGEHVAQFAEPTQRAASLGFAIGNHTFNHANLLQTSDDGIRWQLATTDTVLRQLGIDPGRRMRSPYGADNDHVISIIHALGMVPIGWPIDSMDYASGDPATIAHRVVTGLQPNKPGHNIVLMHDGIDQPDGAGRVASSQSLPAVPLIVDEARREGYCFTQFNPAGDLMIPAPVWTDGAWHTAPAGTRP